MRDFKEVLKEVKYVLLDMDGTVYLGDRLIGEMDKTLDKIRESGKKIIFLFFIVTPLVSKKFVYLV